jgi:hypothetical protein
MTADSSPERGSGPQPYFLARADFQQFLHHVVQIAVPLASSEGVVQVRYNGYSSRYTACACGFGVTGDDRAGDGRAQRAGLRRARDLHRAARHVGVDLHDQRVLLGDAAAVDDLFDLHAVFLESVDDRQRAEAVASINAR